MSNFLEIKRHKNKPEQRFACELLHREPGYAVLRYSSEKPGLISDIEIPAGSITIAHYWQDRFYVAWRMFDSAHTLIGTLFHICSNVSIDEDRLAYDDLLLDIWIGCAGNFRTLDEDEVREALSTGMLSDIELTIIDNAHWHINNHYTSIIDDLAAFETLHSPVSRS